MKVVLIAGLAGLAECVWSFGENRNPHEMKPKYADHLQATTRPSPTPVPASSQIVIPFPLVPPLVITASSVGPVPSATSTTLAISSPTTIVIVAAPETSLISTVTSTSSTTFPLTSISPQITSSIPVASTIVPAIVTAGTTGTVSSISCPTTSSTTATSTAIATGICGISQNVTMAFRLENTQNEYYAAQQFCANKTGTYCYTPQACGEGICMATVIISCPEAIFLKCREGYVCWPQSPIFGVGNATNPTTTDQFGTSTTLSPGTSAIPTGTGGNAQCLALIDTLPSGASSPNIMVTNSSIVFEVTTINGGVSTCTPTRCRGPNPKPLEDCLMTTGTTGSVGGVIMTAGVQTAPMTSMSTLATCDIY